MDNFEEWQKFIRSTSALVLKQGTSPLLTDQRDKQGDVQQMRRLDGKAIFFLAFLRLYVGESSPAGSIRQVVFGDFNCNPHTPLREHYHSTNAGEWISNEKAWISDSIWNLHTCCRTYTSLNFRGSGCIHCSSHLPVFAT